MSAATGVPPDARPQLDDPTLLRRIAERADVRLARGSRGGVGGGRRAVGRTSDGARVLVRVGHVSSAGDPRPSATLLRRIGPSPVRPRIHRAGVLGGVAWTVEDHLPGRTPRRVDGPLLAQVERHLDDLPRGDGSPTGPGRDLRVLALCLPQHRQRLLDLAVEVDEALGPIPSIAVHGDLWRGNLLTRSGRLTGIVDWDAARLDGAPGQDLIHLLALERRRTTRETLTAIVADDPWRWPEVGRAIAAASPSGDVAPAIGRAVTFGWWAAHVAGTITRVPARRDDAEWLGRHVDGVLSSSTA